jgi:hypothetical protein
MNTHKARAVLVGLGPIGIEVGKALAGRAGIELIGAADPAPDKAGKPLSALLDGAFPNVAIRPSAAALYADSAAARGKSDVVLLCTGSRLHAVLPQIEEAIEAGFHIVSTCEELSYAELRHLPMARQIDRKAREKGVAVLGTGVNPGLVMDRLVLGVAAACVRVDSVKVTSGSRNRRPSSRSASACRSTRSPRRSSPSSRRRKPTAWPPATFSDSTRSRWSRRATKSWCRST